MSYGPQTGLDKTGKSRLVTSVWNGGAADSAKQHQKCNVRFFLLPTLPQFHFLQRFLDAFPEMISFLAASMWSWKSLIAADIVSSSVLASTIFFQKRSHFWQTSSRGVLICIWVNLIHCISMRDLQGPYICDSSQDCRYLWWTSFFVSDAERYIGGIPSLPHGASGCVMPNSTA